MCPRVAPKKNWTVGDAPSFELSARDRTALLRAVAEAIGDPLPPNKAKEFIAGFVGELYRYGQMLRTEQGPTRKQVIEALERSRKAIDVAARELQALDEISAELLIMANFEPDEDDPEKVPDDRDDLIEPLNKLQAELNWAIHCIRKDLLPTHRHNFAMTRMDKGWTALGELLKEVAILIRGLTDKRMRCFYDRSGEPAGYAGNFLCVAEEVARIVHQEGRLSIGKLAQQALKAARTDRGPAIRLVFGSTEAEPEGTLTVRLPLALPKWFR